MGADQLRADIIPTHLQIVGELNRDKWRSDLALVEGSNKRYTMVGQMRTTQFENFLISGKVEPMAMSQTQRTTISYALRVRIPTG